MTTEATEWWWAEGSEQRGPVSRDEILRRVAEGSIGRDTLVWHTGMSGWTPASLVPDLPFRPASPPGGESEGGVPFVGEGADSWGSGAGPMDRNAGAVGGAGTAGSSAAGEESGFPASARPAPPGSAAVGGGGLASATTGGRGERGAGGFESAGPGYGGSGGGYGAGGHDSAAPGYGGGYGGGPSLPARTPGNNMILAIVATVLCCLPLGIVAIVKASQVKAIAEGGDIARAQKVANEAKAWALWSIGIGLLAQIIYMAVIGGSALLGLMDGVQDF